MPGKGTNLMKRSQKYWAWIASVLLILGSTVRAAGPSSQPSRISSPGSDLTSLGLEDLMNMEVTSVSKSVQKISEAPAAISVILPEDIHRSGLNSVPELLRLVPGLDVEQINANRWAITSRGF